MKPTLKPPSEMTVAELFDELSCKIYYGWAVRTCLRNNVEANRAMKSLIVELRKDSILKDKVGWYAGQ